jgi:hypothetical protein
MILSITEREALIKMINTLIISCSYPTKSKPFIAIIRPKHLVPDPYIISLEDISKIEYSLRVCQNMYIYIYILLVTKNY